MMKSLVEGKQENGSKGGEKHILKVEDRMGFKDMFSMSVGMHEGTLFYRACLFFTTAPDACTAKLRTE